MKIVSPAGHRTVGSHSAGVISPGTDRDESALWRGGLTIGVIAPAYDGAVVAHPAGVADVFKWRRRGQRGTGFLRAGRRIPLARGKVSSGAD